MAVVAACRDDTVVMQSGVAARSARRKWSPENARGWRPTRRWPSRMASCSQPSAPPAANAAVCTIKVYPETGLRHAGADPQREGYALAWW